jgi:hypothetical protein
MMKNVLPISISFEFVTHFWLLFRLDNRSILEGFFSLELLRVFD